MRGTYSAAVAATLLENEMLFGHVYGVSAGSTNAVNYVARDIQRTRDSFLLLSVDDEAIGTRYFLQHKGWFNAPYMYQQMGLPDGRLPFDFDAFEKSSTKLTISAFERDRGRTRFFTKEDMRTIDDLMVRVRASSTVPIVMPPAKVDNEYCYDGGLAEGNGILLPQARRDGYEKFLVIRTRPRGFRKPLMVDDWVINFFWHRPAMQEALRMWGPGYNAICDELELLEKEGRAYVFYAEDMNVENNTTDLDDLVKCYELGRAQIRRELSAIESFVMG